MISLITEIDNITKDTIATHNGQFHCDELLAIAILTATIDVPNLQVLRTRNLELLEKCKMCIDVSGKYDGTRYFDHHQAEFNETMTPISLTLLSSAGLIWRHYGKTCIKTFSESLKPSYNLTINNINDIWKSVYLGFVRGIDAKDNGKFKSEISTETGTEAIMDQTSLSERVKRYNLDWFDTKADNSDEWLLAYDMVRDDFYSYLKNEIINSTHKNIALSEISSAIKKVIKNNSYLILDRYLPFDILLTKLKCPETIKFVIYPTREGTWNLQGIRKNANAFGVKQRLPLEWSGLTTDSLTSIFGFSGATFVHKGCWLMGAYDKETLIKIADTYL